MLVFGIFGYIMKRFGFPPGPLILGVILGPIAESNLHRALLISNGHIEGMFSPLACILLLGAAFSLVFPIIRKKREGTES
jgi:putative tricarboxylic transport membrane protein